MIQLESVSKVYHTSNGDVRAIDDLTLHVARGEFVAVRGPSGCGKSTLLSLIGGLTQPTSGQVVVDGGDLGRMSSAQCAAFRAEHLGFVFQMFHLLPYLNVLQNVLVAADSGKKQQARELLDQFRLGERLTHRPSELSAGERQRVAMARALLNGPSLLLADEPTGNLDPDNARGVLDLLVDFHTGGGTILLVTHEDFASERAQRTILLDAGRLVEGSPEVTMPTPQ